MPLCSLWTLGTPLNFQLFGFIIWEMAIMVYLFYKVVAKMSRACV